MTRDEVFAEALGPGLRTMMIMVLTIDNNKAKPTSQMNPLTKGSHNNINVYHFSGNGVLYPQLQLHANKHSLRHRQSFPLDR